MAKRKAKKVAKSRGWMKDDPDDWKARAADEFYEMLERARKDGVLDLRGMDLRGVDLRGVTLTTADRKRSTEMYEAVREAIEHAPPPVHLKSSILIIPKKKTAEGVLISSTSLMWAEIVAWLQNRWDDAYQIPPEKWEEIVAGAFHKAGFDEVTLTPRSGDFGRDVIAIKNGFGSMKVIGSVKAYAPDRRVRQDDVRALLGVMSGEQNVSKGIITTTGKFAPRIKLDPYIKPFLPTRLELIDGDELRVWLSSLVRVKEASES